MKRLFILSLLFVLIAPLMSVVQARAAYRDKTVLILNSYRGDLDWSRRISDSVAAQLRNKYPQINISIQYLNADIVPYYATRSLILRSIMWSISHSKDSMNVESLAASTIYSDSFQPDAFVIIGEDAFSTILQQRRMFNKWIHVPIVLCAVNSVAPVQYWDPETRIDLDNVLPIETRKNISDSLLVENIKSYRIEGIDKFPEIRLSNGKLALLWETQLNVTGVKVPNYIEQNLEMIFQFHPNLKEIVWVDNDYYKSEYAFNSVKKFVKQFYGSSVKLRTMLNNRINTDSIYNEMLREVPGRVFLTYSWNIDAVYSKRSQAQMDSLFTNHFTTPFYSLSQMNNDNNYFVGGRYADAMECSQRTVAIIQRIFEGEKASQIPFDSVIQSKLILNRTTLLKHGLIDQAKAIDGVLYENIPPTFYQKHERTIWSVIVALVIIICIVFIYVRHRRYCKIIERDTERFRRLYNKIQTIYGNASIDFAFYDKQGECMMWVVDGKKNQTSGNGVSLLKCNLLENQNFTSKQLMSLQQSTTQMISKEVMVGQDWYRLIAKSVDFKDYAAVAYMAVVTDINKIIAEREERILYEQMFEFVSDFSKIGIASYNTESNTGSATEYWYTNLNEKSNEIAMPPSYGSVSDDDRTSLVHFWNRTLEHSHTDRFSRDIRVKGDDGKWHWVRQNIFANLNHDGQIIEINLNIDSQKKIENRLIEAKRKAEESERKIIEFLENISHEIRTPLNSIIGFSSMIANSDSEDDEMFKDVIKSNQTMFKELLDNVVNMSNIDSAKVTFRRDDIDVNALFDNLRDITLDYIGDRPITVSVVGAAQGTVIHSDKHYIEILLANLLSNAVKFTDSGHIRLAYQVMPHDGEHCISVSDTGIGIAPEHHERVFTRFEKLNKYAQGAGLGLSLCRSIIRHLNGTIDVDSKEGKGTTFRIKFRDL